MVKKAIRMMKSYEREGLIWFRESRKGLYVKVTFVLMPKKKLIRCQLCQDLQRGSFRSKEQTEQVKMHRDENERLEEDAPGDGTQRGRKEVRREVGSAQSLVSCGKVPLTA